MTDGIQHELELGCAPSKENEPQVPFEAVGGGAGGKAESPSASGGVLGGQFGHVLAMAFWRGDNFHFLPIVRELATAFETNYVCPR
jgi:hypothetical protein